MSALRLQLVQEFFHVAVPAHFFILLSGDQALCHWHFFRHDGQAENCEILLVLMRLHLVELLVDLAEMLILRCGLAALFLYRAKANSMGYRK